MRDPIRHLKDLQRWRGAKGYQAIVAGSIATDLTSLKAGLERQASRLGNAVEIWQRVIPKEICEDTRISGLAAGVLAVITGSAATSYALDRALRGGAEGQLRAASEGRIIRVRMRIGKVTLDP